MPTFPDRLGYTDYVDGVSSGTVIDNSEYQNQQKRAEDFFLFENAHLYKSYGWLTVPKITKPSTRRLTFARDTSNPCRYVSDLGYWEIPADLSIDFNTLTDGVAYNKIDYLYLELFRYKTGSGAYPSFVKNAFGGKVGYRLNIYQGNSAPTISTTPDKTTSVRDTGTEEGHVIFPLASVLRYQTTDTPEADFTNLLDISVSAVLSLGKMDFPKTISALEALIQTHSFEYCYDWSALPNASPFPWVQTINANSSATVENGELTVIDSASSGEYALIYTQQAQIKDSDIVIVQHRCKTTNAASGGIASCPFLEITHGFETVKKRFRLSGDYINNKIWLYDASQTNSVKDFFITARDYHTYTCIFDRNIGAYLFVDGQFLWFVSFANLHTYSTARDISISNNYSGSGEGFTLISDFFKYSVIKENIRSLIGNKVELHDGANNLEIAGKAITNKTTNGDVDITANGTGSVNATNTNGYKVAGAQKVSSTFVQNDTAIGTSVRLENGSEAIRLTNRTGANTSKGAVVRLDASNDNSFVVAEANATNAIGVVLENGIANGSACWVAVGASFEALLKDTTSATRGQYAMVSDTVGRIISTATAPTTIAEAQKYLGYIAENKTAGTSVLVRVIRKHLGG